MFKAHTCSVWINNKHYLSCPVRRFIWRCETSIWDRLWLQLRWCPERSASYCKSIMLWKCQRSEGRRQPSVSSLQQDAAKKERSKQIYFAAAGSEGKFTLVNYLGTGVTNASPSAEVLSSPHQPCAILRLLREKSNNSSAVFGLMCEQSWSEWGESPESGGLEDVHWMSKSQTWLRDGQEMNLVGDAQVTGEKRKKKQGQDASVSQRARKCKPQKTLPAITDQTNYQQQI